MIKFTHLCTRLCAVLILLSGGAICVKAATAADLFGTYTFTATITFASDEYKTLYADALKSECEVTIAAKDYYDFGIAGIAGSSGIQGGSFDGTKITINNPSTGDYYLWSSAQLGVGDKEGVYNEPLTYTYDEATGNITMPDFTAVKITNWTSDPITTETVATFTNCKLTLKNKTEIKVDDLTGDWHFKAGTGKYSTNSASTFPTEFDLTLSTTDATFKTYSGVLTFAGYDPIQLSGITFDGVSFVIPINSTYINADQTMRLGDSNGQSESNITFNYTGKILSLTSGISIVKKGDDGKAVTEQWYIDGTLSKIGAVETPSWAGTYTINVGYAYVMKTDVDYPKEGGSFTIKITKNESMDKYYVTEFMGNDTYYITYGGIPCEEDGNTLKISTGDTRYVASRGANDDYSEMYYDVLYDGQGTTSSTVDITRNDDGTYNITDFFLKRATLNLNTYSTTVESAAYYSQLTVSDFVSGISTVTAESNGDIKVADGVIILDGAQSVTVYNAGGAVVFSGVTSKVSGLANGLYIVKAAGKAVKVVL